jgi:hypothetical protein
LGDGKKKKRNRLSINSHKSYICPTKKISAMFNQVVGSGANAFLIIIAVLAGFVAGLSYVDFRRQKEKEEAGDNH